MAPHSDLPGRPTLATRLPEKFSFSFLFLLHRIHAGISHLLLSFQNRRITSVLLRFLAWTTPYSPTTPSSWDSTKAKYQKKKSGPSRDRFHTRTLYNIQGTWPTQRNPDCRLHSPGITTHSHFKTDEKPPARGEVRDTAGVVFYAYILICFHCPRFLLWHR